MLTQMNSFSSLSRGQQKYISELETAIAEIAAAKDSGKLALLEAAIDRARFLISHN